jgi:hypothetical protein
MYSHGRIDDTVVIRLPVKVYIIVCVIRLWIVIISSRVIEQTTWEPAFQSFIRAAFKTA